MGNTNSVGEAGQNGGATPRPVRARGFTPTTAVLIAVLLGVLFFVGRIVNPPPPEPQKQAPAAATPTPKAPAMPDPAQIKAKLEAQHKMEEQKRKEHEAMKAANGGREPKLVNDSGTDVTSQFFQDHKMGEAGVKQTEAELAHSKMLEEAARKATGAKAPSTTPTPAPPGASIPQPE